MKFVACLGLIVGIGIGCTVQSYEEDLILRCNKLSEGSVADVSSELGIRIPTSDNCADSFNDGGCPPQAPIAGETSAYCNKEGDCLQSCDGCSIETCCREMVDACSYFRPWCYYNVVFSSTPDYAATALCKSDGRTQEYKCHIRVLVDNWSVHPNEAGGKSEKWLSSNLERIDCD